MASNAKAAINLKVETKHSQSQTKPNKAAEMNRILEQTDSEGK